MTAKQILIAEDDINIREGLVDTLESEGYEVTAAENGQIALDSYKHKTFDLIVLDVMMPEMSGYDVLKAIRAKDSVVPVIMLTAKGEEIDKVVGLTLGADDYITKPFGVYELLARISAVLRRANANHQSEATGPDETQETRNDEPFQFGDATVMPKKLIITRPDGDPECEPKYEIDITDRELKLLILFYTHKNEVLSRDKLLNDIWGIDYYGTTRTLDQHIAQLRKKVEKDPSTPTLIVTVHGVGYKYKSD